MKRGALLALFTGVILLLSLMAYSAAELTVYDMEFAGKPFNEGDDGRVQRVLLRDHDSNSDDVVLTKLTVENLGSATNDEIAWVKVEIEVDGRVITLAESEGFPISLVLLSMPLDQRTIPDDASAMLTIYVGIGSKIVDGHTIQTQVDIRYSEGGEGGEALAKDRYPEVVSRTENLSAGLVATLEGGILNPGDELPVMQVQISDPPDSNFRGLQVTEARITGPALVQWILGTDTQKIPIASGQSVVLTEPIFAAFDEGAGTITLWARIPVDASIPSPITVQPQLELTVAEGESRTNFTFSDTTPDTIVRGGFEELQASASQGGMILSAPQAGLAYSVVTLGDHDRNSSWLRVQDLELRCLGTVCSQLSNVEIEDGQGSLVAYSGSLGRIALSAPAGGPIRVSDDGMTALRVAFDVSSPVPLGGSLLLSHLINVQEIGLRMLGEEVHFSGIQEVVPEKAIFFGRPTFALSAEEGAVSITTDGETIKTLTLSLAYGPDNASVVPEVVPGSFARVTNLEAYPEEGRMSLTLDVTRPSADPLVGISFMPAESVTNAVELQISLDVEKVVDTAGIELPYTVAPRSVTLVLEPSVPVEHEVPAVPAQQQSPATAPAPQTSAQPGFIGLAIRPSYRQGDIMSLSFGIMDENGSRVPNAAVSISIVGVEGDQSGAVVYVDAIPYNPANQQYELKYDTSVLSAGVYDVQISTSGGLSEKIRIEIKP